MLTLQNAIDRSRSVGQSPCMSRFAPEASLPRLCDRTCHFISSSTSPASGNWGWCSGLVCLKSMITSKNLHLATSFCVEFCY
ncbi:hypothetical protein, partial [Moorena sp. SIO4A5]|uniref:hypothetical protein n=1 Tax=Moorena sp. SIO4A5 TaxID=2607838 RepID=UPI0025D66953